MKAIAIAASQGQKIYTVTQKNAAVALSKITLTKSILSEIQDAIASGKEVILHEKAISFHGFNGYGYLIIDQETGTGAYLIENSGNGGDMEYELLMIAPVAICGLIGTAYSASFFFLLSITIILIWLSLMLFFIAYEPYGVQTADNSAFYGTTAIAALSGIAGIFASFGSAITIAIMSWVYGSAFTSFLPSGCKNIKRG